MQLWQKLFHRNIETITCLLRFTRIIAVFNTVRFCLEAYRLCRIVHSIWLCLNDVLPNSLFSLASSHRFTTLITPRPATRGIIDTPPIRSMFCSWLRFKSFDPSCVVLVMSCPKFDAAGGILSDYFLTEYFKLLANLIQINFFWNQMRFVSLALWCFEHD